MMSSIYITHELVELSELAALGQEVDWRAQAISKLQRYGLRVVNPIDWAMPFLDEPEGVEKRVRRALDLIDQCDVLLANLHRPNHGTGMEIFYAHRSGKIVTVVGQPPFSPWVVSHSQARFGEIDTALDFLIGEGLQTDLLNWAVQFESQLADRYEQYPPAGEPDYQFFGGEVPVLICTPHSTGYFRDGEFLEPDIFTGALAASVNRSARCHSLIGSYCMAADPCKFLQTPMIRAMCDVIKAGQIQMAIILAGMNWHEANSFTIEADASATDLVARLKQKLSPLGDVVVREHTDLAELQRFIGESFSIPSLMLRAHRRFRMPRLQPEAFMAFHNALSDFVHETGVEYLRSAS